MNDDIINFTDVNRIKRSRTRKHSTKSVKKRPPFKIINVPPHLREEPEYNEEIIGDLRILGSEKGRPKKFERKPFIFDREIKYLEIDTNRPEPEKITVLKYSYVILTDSLIKITNNLDSDFVKHFVDSIPYNNFNNFVYEFNTYISVLDNSKLAGFVNLQTYIRKNKLETITLKRKLRDRFALFSHKYKLFSQQELKERIERYLYPTARIRTRPTFPPFVIQEPESEDEMIDDESRSDDNSLIEYKEEIIDDLDSLIELNEEVKNETFEQLMSILDNYESGNFMSPTNSYKKKQAKNNYCKCIQCGAEQKMEDCLKSKIKTKDNNFETIYFCCFRCFEDKNDWKRVSK